ncbi:MAG: hypothetical protein KAT15_03365, partial [Bacteroidales bacterium]|nr:hypothetical protein [Bacteroidales bacterium]
KVCANLNTMYVAAAMNHLYAAQGRSATNSLAQMTRELYQKDSLLTEHYHHELAGGKWKHMMSQTHIGYTYWQQPEHNSMPEVLEISVPDRAVMGVAIEHSRQAWPESEEEAILPVYDALNQQEYYIEIFNRGSLEFFCTITPSVPWILTSAPSLTVDLQERIYLAINWEEVPDGYHSVSVEIKGPGNVSIPVIVEVDNRFTRTQLPKKELFVDMHGLVSMEAANFQRARDGNSSRWEEIPNLGKTVSSMITLPVSSAPTSPGGDSPRLEYDFYLRDTGTFAISSYLSPTLNFHNNEGPGFGVSVDDETPRLVQMHQSQQRGMWEKRVSNNIHVETTMHHISEPGIHTLHWWRADAGVVLQKIVISKHKLNASSYLGPPESLMINQEPPLPD